MGRFTLYRADIDSARLARVLGKVPGVAVADDEESDEAPTADDETAAPAAWTEGDDDDGGLREKLPDADIVDEEQTSVVKTYGLLGLGVSMVMLGIATVGIWVYLRRKDSDGEASETPPPATGLDTAEPAASRTGAEPSTGAPDTAPTADQSPVESAAEPEEAPEPHGRTEGDRTDVEWTTRDTTPEPATEERDEPSLDATESETDEDEPRPTESVDAAPLLGVAFLAVSGAVVKWLQSSGEDASE